jgi:hypothetical protein
MIVVQFYQRGYFVSLSVFWGSVHTKFTRSGF